MSLDLNSLVKYFKRNLTIVGCGALMVGLLVVLYFRADQPAKLSATLEERSALLRKLKANVVNSAHLDSQVRVLSGLNQSIAANALRVGDLAQNLKLFYDLESHTGVRLTDVRPLNLAAAPKTAPSTFYVAIPFAITVDGDYRQLIAFLKGLETGHAFCRILSASIPASVEDKQRVTLNIEVLGVRS